MADVLGELSTPKDSPLTKYDLAPSHKNFNHKIELFLSESEYKYSHKFIPIQ